MNCFRIWPHWLYLLDNPRGRAMLFIATLNIVGIMLVRDMDCDILKLQKSDMTSKNQIVNNKNGGAREAMEKLSNEKADDDVSIMIPKLYEQYNDIFNDRSTEAEFVTVVSLAEVNTDDYFTSDSLSTTIIEEIKSTEEINKRDKSSKSYQTSFAIDDKNQISFESKQLEKLRSIWLVYLLFFAYNSFVLLIHVFCKVFTESERDVYGILVMPRPRCRRKPEWRYLYSTPRGNTMFLILLVCVVGIKMTFELYDDVFPSKEVKLVPTANDSLVEAIAEIDNVTEYYGTMDYDTELFSGENEGTEEASNNSEDSFLDTSSSVESYKDKYSENSEEGNLLNIGENDSFVGQSSAFKSVIPIENDLRIIHQKRLLWCIHCFFFAYNLIVVVVHIFVKMFLKSKDDIYKRTTVMTLMINWMLTFLAVLSIKGTGYLILPFVLEITLTFLVTFIKCKIYPEVSLVSEESADNQIAEANGDVSPQEQMLLEDYVNHQRSRGRVDAEDADLSNAEEGHSVTEISANEETIFIEDRVDVGDVGLQYHDENEDRSSNKEPGTTNLSSKNK